MAAGRHHKIRFTNLQTGRGYIDGYATKRYALKVVEQYDAQLAKDNGVGIKAVYLGDERVTQKAKEAANAS